MFDMINIFEVFLPQLLRYPNPTDPLNGEAAALLMREPKSYDAKVKGIRNTTLPQYHGPRLILLTNSMTDYVTRYASKQAADEAGEETESEDEMSSVGSFGSEDEDPVGQMEV